MTFGSLFAGIGGLDLGLERAGMTCRWQVEIDPFCTSVLEKHWPQIPKYGDIKQLTGAEFEPVDLICGGYPCQPFSQAGKRAGEADPRHLWPDFARIIRALRPKIVLLENVPGHLSLGFGGVLGDLARLGYDAEWFCLRACDFGAAHLRKRVFIVAHAMQSGSSPERPEQDQVRRASPTSAPSGYVAHASRDARHGSHGQDGQGRGVCEASDTVADAHRGQRQQSGRPIASEQQLSGFDGRRSTLADARAARLPDAQQTQLPRARRRVEGRAATELRFAPGPADPRWPAILRERPDLAPALESPLRRVADGIPTGLDRVMSDRTKRLKGLGNAVVPQIAEWIGRQIIAKAQEEPCPLQV